MGKINWLAILLCVVLSMGLGFLWYGFLFNSQWMAGNGITMSEDNLAMFKNGVEVPISQTPMILNTIAMVIYGLFMNWLINKTGDTSASGGAKLGFILGLISTLGIILTNLFAQNPTSLSYVDGSYMIVLFTMFGAIIGGWRK